MDFVPEALKAQVEKKINRYNAYKERKKDVPEETDSCDPVISDLPPLNFDPEDFKTPEFCESAIKKDGRALKYVPIKFLTAEICHEAVMQYPELIEYVPDLLRNMISTMSYSAIVKNIFFDNISLDKPKNFR